MHVRRALALAVVGPLLLAGCTGDPEPTPKIPDPTTSSSSPSPTDSETPEAESAEEFIRRWSTELKEMQASGETDEFRALGPDCESCSQAATRIEGIYEGGGDVQWDGYEIVSIEKYGKAPNQFRVEVDSAPTRLRETPNGEWQTLPGGRISRLMELRKTDAGWLVARTAELAG
jgi:hypothetical protein